jgi:hypothetical protein
MLSEANVPGDPKKSSAFVGNMFQTGSREKSCHSKKENPDGNVEKGVDLSFLIDVTRVHYAEIFKRLFVSVPIKQPDICTSSATNTTVNTTGAQCTAVYGKGDCWILKLPQLPNFILHASKLKKKI